MTDKIGATARPASTKRVVVVSSLLVATLVTAALGAAVLIRARGGQDDTHARTAADASTTASADRSGQGQSVGRISLADVGAFPSTDGVVAVAFSPDGRYLATADDIDKTARLWSVADQNLLVTLNAGGIGGYGDVTGISFSHDGRTLTTTCRDGTTRFWEVPGGRQVTTFDGMVTDDATMALSPDERYAVTYKPEIPERYEPKGGSITIIPAVPAVRKLWDVPSHSVIASVDPAHLILFHPDGRVMEMASGDDYVVRLSDAVTRQPLVTLTGHTGEVLDGEFSPDGRLFATIGRDDMVRVWNMATGQAIGAFPSKISSTVQFSLDSRLLAATSANVGGTHLWNTVSRQPAGTIDLASQSSFGPDGRLLVTIGDDGGPIGLWDVTGDQPTLIRAELPGSVFSPDGQLLAKSSGPVSVWRVTLTP